MAFNWPVEINFMDKTMNKEQVFRQLVENEANRDKYFGKIPSDIQPFVIDNEYTNNLLHERDMLIRLIFGEYSEAIEWFLYEWRPGFEVRLGDKSKKINDIDEYIEWMKENESFN